MKKYIQLCIIFLERYKVILSTFEYKNIPFQIEYDNKYCDNEINSFTFNKAVSLVSNSEIKLIQSLLKRENLTEYLDKKIYRYYFNEDVIFVLFQFGESCFFKL